jgi:hypothetical protein
MTKWWCTLSRNAPKALTNKPDQRQSLEAEFAKRTTFDWINLMGEVYLANPIGGFW